MPRSLLALVVLSLCTLPTTTPAQSLDDICEDIAVVRAGEWIEFSFLGQPGLDSMRFANVGDETLDGEMYHRYEMRLSSPQGSMVTQTLSAGRIFDVDDIKEMVLQMPGMPTQRLTGDMLQSSLAMRPSRWELIADDVCKAAESLGRETVNVPAGDIEALHIRTAEGDEAWISSDVPGAMVKVVTKDGMTMVLVRHGTGAESSIQ